MSEQKWREIEVRKVTAVVRCLICGNINRNEDFGNHRIGRKALVHCPGCNQNRQHLITSKIMEVYEMAEMVDVVTEETIVDLKTFDKRDGSDDPSKEPESEEPEG